MMMARAKDRGGAVLRTPTTKNVWGSIASNIPTTTTTTTMKIKVQGGTVLDTSTTRKLQVKSVSGTPSTMRMIVQGDAVVGTPTTIKNNVRGGTVFTIASKVYDGAISSILTTMTKVPNWGGAILEMIMTKKVQVRPISGTPTTIKKKVCGGIVVGAMKTMTQTYYCLALDTSTTMIQVDSALTIMGKLQAVKPGGCFGACEEYKASFLVLTSMVAMADSFGYSSVYMLQKVVNKRMFCIHWLQRKGIGA
jgi:hypothetical protein